MTPKKNPQTHTAPMQSTWEKRIAEIRNISGAIQNAYSERAKKYYIKRADWKDEREPMAPVELGTHALALGGYAGNINRARHHEEGSKNYIAAQGSLSALIHTIATNYPKEAEGIFDEAFKSLDKKPRRVR